MLDKSLITKEIVEALKTVGIEGRGTKVAIADICGLSRATVGLWFNDSFPNQRPTLESLVKLSLATGVSLDQLVFGNNRPGKISIFSENINEQIPEWHSTGSIYDPWERRGKNYFAVRLDDDSMTSSTEKSYPKGRLMVFDADTKANDLKSGIIVFAKIMDNPSFGVCRQFIKVGSEIRLVALNPKYSTDITDKDIEIKGILAFSIEEESY